MGWNIGNSGETGLFVGGENIIRDNLIFYLDPGDYNCIPDGGSLDSTCTELALGDTGNVTSPGNDIGDLWDVGDGAPCLSFTGNSTEYITFPTIDVSEFVTGNNVYLGAISCGVWFRTGDTSMQNAGPLVSIESYTFGVFFNNDDPTVFAASRDNANHEYCYESNTATNYMDDNWHFLVGVMNNTLSTLGDTTAGACALYIDDMITPKATSTFHSTFEFRTTDANLSIAAMTANSWYWGGEIGPVMMYSDYCLSEEERIYNYNVHRHRYYDTAIG